MALLVKQNPISRFVDSFRAWYNPVGTKDAKLKESLDKISTPDGNGGRYYFIVPFDHRLSDGPLPGVSTTDEINQLHTQLNENGGTAVLGHIGDITGLHYRNLNIGLITHLNGETSASAEYTKRPYMKTRVTNVEEAIYYSDAVSFHINVSSSEESQQFGEFCTVKDQRENVFDKYIVNPAAIAMAYPREGFDKQIENKMNELHKKDKKNPKYDPEMYKAEHDIEYIRKAVIAGAQVGGNPIKTIFAPKYPEEYKEVVKSVFADIVMAGGPKTDDPLKFLEYNEAARDAGVRGISVGRNIFGIKPHSEGPGRMMKAIVLIYTKNMSAEEAFKVSGLEKLIKQT